MQQRYAAYAVDSGVPASDAERAITAISSHLPVLSPEDDEALLRAAGFDGVELFTQGFHSRAEWLRDRPESAAPAPRQKKSVARRTQISGVSLRPGVQRHQFGISGNINEHVISTLK